MTLVAALTASAALFLLATRPAPSRLADRLAAYLTPGPAPPGLRPARGRRIDRQRVRVLAAAGAGAAIGAMSATAASPAPRSIAGLTIAGAAAGGLSVRVAATQRREARRRRLRQELPTAADAIALHVLAGESIPVALERFCDEAGGVVADELAAVLHDHGSGATLPEALASAARTSDHPDAARLYEALAHAHHTGGRLADGLAALAVDFRAAAGRDLLAEGGRRALATYGPILALQIPVTLLFLMYPTLVGLGELSATR
jgi:Flp pilus assembly protein TadB